MQKLTIIAVLSKGFYLIVDDNADPKNLQAKGWTFNMNTGVFYTVQVHSVLKFSPYAEKFTGDPAPILAAFATAEKDDDPE